VAGIRNDEFTWPTPELPHRCSQLYIEPVLRRAAERHKRNAVQYGATVRGLRQDEDGVTATVAMAGGEEKQYRARYMVGCDGPRSTVRGLLGLQYAGTAGEKREFMGGRMAAAYFSAPDLYRVMPGPRAWQYWTLNLAQRALIVSVDGRGRFIINVQLREGQEPDNDDLGRRIANAIGADVPFELISNSVWTAGFALVAEKMREGRVFLAGDAAHLFTPTGGLGYNTGIEDAANLAWKLQALAHGLAGPMLADSYEAERRPAALRNTGFAREFANSIGLVRLPAEIEAEGPHGEAARASVGAYLNFHARKEFVIPGVHLGTRYEGSPIVATEPGSPPADTANLYVPVGRPGHRAPHVWLEDGASLYDRLGMGFVLLRLGAAARGPAAGLPARVGQLAVASEQARDLYGADYVLLRPDQHIAWRGNDTGEALRRALRLSLGFPDRPGPVPSAI